MKKSEETVVLAVIAAGILLSVAWWAWNEPSPQRQELVPAPEPVVRQDAAPAAPEPAAAAVPEPEQNATESIPAATAAVEKVETPVPATTVPAPAFIAEPPPVVVAPRRPARTRRIRPLIHDPASSIPLQLGQILVYWDRENEFGAVRMDRLTREKGVDYTWWRIQEQAQSAGTFSGAVEQTGHADEEEPAIRCGKALFHWSEKTGMRVPDGYSVSIVTNRNITEVDILSLKWQISPFRE